jgi:hypothetical protein
MVLKNTSTGKRREGGCGDGPVDGMVVGVEGGREERGEKGKSCGGGFMN